MLGGRLTCGVNSKSNAGRSHETENDGQVLYTKKSRRKSVAGDGGEVWEGKLACMFTSVNFRYY
jgi:hypothetical protein